jgi:hypothetical protein
MRSFLIIVTLVAPLAITTVAAAAAPGAAEPFAGNWQLRMDKSDIPETYKFLAVGEGKFQTDNGLGLGFCP